MKAKRCCIPACKARHGTFAVIARDRRTGRVFSRVLACRLHRPRVAAAFAYDVDATVEIRRRRREAPRS